jgi:hypothetical protein
VNLRNKRFYFLNEPLSEKAYQKKISSLDLETHNGLTKLRKNFLAHCQQFPVKFMEGVNNEDVLGNYLTNCKNAEHCFDSRKLWDCKYVTQGFDTAQNCMDCTEVGDGVELLYECYCLGYGAHNNRFCTHQLGRSADLNYCYFTPYCKNCFGCVGLHHAEYRILNKQYSKEEYEALLPQLIEHMESTKEWGEFFPMDLSPFAYNETMAYEHFPLTEAEVQNKELRWKNFVTTSKYDGPAYEVPEKIKDVTDEILDKILSCEITGKNYRITKPGLKFYRAMNLPIPQFHPDERHRQRTSLRNARQLYDRNCAECQKSIQTTYPSDQPEKLLCKECYLKVVD